MVIANTISIALCTYNGAAWISDQLESILTQTLPATEIVLCDDGSTDNTLAIVESFAQKYPGIFRIYKNEKNLGPRKNFDKAIGLCTGDFIFLCDQDDIWLPEKIALCVQSLQQHPQALGVFCNGWLIDEQGASLDETMWDALYWEQPLQTITNPKNLLAYLLINGNIVTGTALCIRKAACDAILPIHTNYNTWHDHWIALVLAASQQLIWISKPLLHYRIHQQQQVGFSGRSMADPAFRKAVHDSWLYTDTVGQWPTTHLAWALQKFEQYEPLLKKVKPDAIQHILNTGQQLKQRFVITRNRWLKTMPWPTRKWKLIKHWLHGGEYLRIGFKEVLFI